MDLKSMMNPDAASAGRTQSSVTDQERSVPPQRSASGTYYTPPVQQHRASSTRPNPNYPQPPAPPPLDTRSAIATSTPIRTPSGYPSSEAQYPFPSAYQSPSTAHQERFPVVTPGGRNPSHYYQQPLASPASGFAPPGFPHSASLTSRTPTSTHSQSPHATRESPHLPHSHSHHSLSYHSQHGSQPSTPQGPPQAPLGPPQPQYNRMSSHGPTNHVLSPYAQHQRTYSGASMHAGRASHSPAQSNAALGGHTTESPAAYAHPADPYKRLSTDYNQNNGERERSLSVSPKTRIYGLPSRQNSQGTYSQRSSFAEQRPLSSERNRAQVPPYIHTPPLHRPGIEHVLSATASPVTQNRASLQHLLSGDRPSEPLNRPSLEAHRSSSIEQPQSISRERPQLLHHSSTGTSYSNPVVESPATRNFSQPPNSGLTTSLTLQQPLTEQSHTMPQDVAKKRRAEQSPEETRIETKKQRKLYEAPPIWARLARTNPRYERQVAAHPNMAPVASNVNKARPSPQPNSQIRTPHQAPRPSPQPQTNGHLPVPAATPAPVSGDQHYGAEKTKVGRVLGIPWEVSILDSKPIDPVLRSVLDFLFYQLVRRPHIGAADVPSGAFEIEAKLGTLVDRRSRERLRFPNTTTMVLDPGFSAENVAFESFMSEVSER